MYNPRNLERSARFQLLADKTGKKKSTIQVYFSRNNMNVMNIDDVIAYEQKYIYNKNEK